MKVFHQIFFILSFIWKRKCTVGMFLFLVFEMLVFFKFDKLPALIPKQQFLTQITRQKSTDLNATTLKKTGNLNLHLWSETCATDLNILCNFPMFPKAPDDRVLLEKTKVTKDLARAEAGMRLFGFIIPYKSGVYRFAVRFCPAEVWLSRNENWGNAKKICDTGKLPQQKKNFAVSDEIELTAGKKHFIEVVATCFHQGNKVQLLWTSPMSSSFEVINGTFLSHYTEDSAFNNSKIYDDLLPDSPVCASRRNKTTYFEVQREISYLSHDKVKDVLPYCDYNASYTVNKRLKKYHAIAFYAIRTFTYPFPEHSDLRAANKHPLDKDEAFEAVGIFMESLERQMPG